MGDDGSNSFAKGFNGAMGCFGAVFVIVVCLAMLVKCAGDNAQSAKEREAERKAHEARPIVPQPQKAQPVNP